MYSATLQILLENKTQPPVQLLQSVLLTTGSLSTCPIIFGLKRNSEPPRHFIDDIIPKHSSCAYGRAFALLRPPSLQLEDPAHENHSKPQLESEIKTLFCAHPPQCFVACYWPVGPENLRERLQ